MSDEIIDIKKILETDYSNVIIKELNKPNIDNMARAFYDLIKEITIKECQNK